MIRPRGESVRHDVEGRALTGRVQRRALPRFASRAATAFNARARRCSGVIDMAACFPAFLARAVRCLTVIDAADFFPPLLPCFRKYSITSAGSFLLGTSSA